jgi:hypothetical protein
VVDKSKFVNHFDLSPEANLRASQDWAGETWTQEARDIPLVQLSNLIPKDVCAMLRNELSLNSWLAVGLDGRSDHTYDEIGNYRLSNYNEGLAQALWLRIQPHMKSLKMDPWKTDARTPTDHDMHELWKPVGVSPLFRYIRYVEGGKLVAHYDETFVASDTQRTLLSLVIYLTSNAGGATRFIEDPQAGMNTLFMDFTDWLDSAKDEQVDMRIEPVEGSAIMFPHRVLHDSEPLLAGNPEKIIIRTDIMFEKV